MAQESRRQIPATWIVALAVPVLAALMMAPALVAHSGYTAPAAQASPVAPPKANAADVGSMDAILAALYDVISGPAGQKRDWDRMRSLFVPGARLIPAVPNEGGAEARATDVDGYIARATPVFEKNGFFEREITRHTDAFGNIAHVFSTYESRHNKDDATPFARGINSIQLLKDGERWWIVTIYWDSERPDNPLPAKYLPGEP